MKILLFDWIASGHHANHVRRFAESLDGHEVIAAVPGELAEQLAGVPAEVVSTGPVPVPLDTTRYLSLAARRGALRELELFLEAVERTRPDRAVALSGDGLVRTLASAPPVSAPTTLSVFRPRAHYPEAYGSPQAPRERVAAVAFERATDRWRRRADAHALLTLDEAAAERWSKRPGAPAYALPEPLLPCDRNPVPAAERSGCVVLGALAPRKGIAPLARAVALEPTSLRVVLAGVVEPRYEQSLAAAVEAMRAAGAEVDLRLGWQTDAEAVRLLANARCAVLPYLRHYGSSGLLAEAAAVGTPLVVHDWGLLAHAVRKHDLGMVVDCNDPRALRTAVLRFADDPEAVDRHADPLLRFAERFDPARFREVVRRAVV